MHAKQKAKWERWRRLGKRRYVLLVTLLHVVGYLLVIPIVTVALFREPFSLGMLVSGAMIGLMLGPIMGLLAWHSSERVYQDFTSRSTSRTD